MLRRVGPWVASAALHAALGAAAIFTVAGMVGRRAPTPEPDASYSVSIRTEGGPRLSSEPRTDERSYGTPQDSVLVTEFPLRGVPDEKLTPAPIEVSPSSLPPGRGHSGIVRERGPVVRFPQAGGGSSPAGEPDAVGTGSNHGSEGGRGAGTTTGVGSGDGKEPGIEAVALSTPPPTYPDEARRGQQQGIVVAEITIDAEGRVTSARAAEGSGSKLLDDAALSAVRGWRYRPATLAGKAVSSVRRVRFVFRLE